MNSTITSTVAKANFFKWGHRVADQKIKVFIKDRSGNLAMTLDHRVRDFSSSGVDISPRDFKDNFARCLALVKTGVVFRVKFKNEPIFARPHTSYQDPLEDIVDQWIANLKAQGATSSGPILDHLDDFEERLDELEERLDERLGQLHRSLERIALGHHPHHEGAMVSRSEPQE